MSEKSTGGVLLVHPPVVRPCEPPPGLARLSGALSRYDIGHRIVDANVEGLLYLCRNRITPRDTWTRRAVSGLERHLGALKHPDIYRNRDRYARAVSDVNRVLQRRDSSPGTRVTLANYQDRALSPVSSSDLLAAFERPEKNPFFPFFQERFSTLLKAAKPRILGISINFLGQALCAFALLGVIRHLSPELRIIAGGGLITSWLKRPDWKNPFSGIIDRLVSGPGEEALLEELGKTHDGVPDLPVYDKFPFSSYLSPVRILPYSASSGCYWRKCAFCPETAEGNPYLPVPPKRALSQLKDLVTTCAPGLVHITDNAVSPALMTALVHHPLEAPWYGFVRFTPELENPDFCRALKASGCVMLQIGLESGSQKVLDAFGKGIDLRGAARSLSNLKAAGIASYIYLLFGTPWETEEDAERTLDFTLRHHPAISFLNLAVFNLPAHGPDAGDMDTLPFYEGDLYLYRDFRHPAGWHRSKVRQFLDKKFKRQPVISEILLRDPPVFTSNHAPLAAF